MYCLCVVNIAMSSNCLSFASVEIDKSYSLTRPQRKILCYRWLRDQPQDQGLSPNDKGDRRQSRERESGNEVEVTFVTDVASSIRITLVSEKRG